MGFVKEFRDFALKGNVFDLAVGVIIGGAFGKIVGSLLDNVMNPIIGRVAGSVDFSQNYMNIGSAAIPAGTKYTDAKALSPVLGYGQFMSDVINFLILAFVVFLMVKMFNTMRKRFEEQKAPPPPPGPTAEQKLLTEIRDLLAKR